MVERAEPTQSRYPYFETRLARMERRFLDPNFQREWRKRTVVLWQPAGEIQLTLNLSPLNSQLANYVEVDSEGTLYLFAWRQTKGILPGYELLGQRTQPGRNYSERPPKTKVPQKLRVIQYPMGIEALLRTTEDIVASTEHEAERLNRLDNIILRLQGVIPRVSQLTDEEKRSITQEHIQFLGEGFLKARNPNKKKIRDTLTRGVITPNVLVDLVRTYSVARQRLLRGETIKAIIAKYSLISNQLHLERNHLRSYLEGVVEVFDEVLKSSVFSDDGAKKATVDRILRQLSLGLLHTAWFQPYSRAAAKVIEHIDFAQFSYLRPGTKAAWMQIQRKTNRRRVSVESLRQKAREKAEVDPQTADYYNNLADRVYHSTFTVRERLDEDNFAEAARLLDHCKWILRKVLDVHEDYLAVKPSKKRAEKLRKAA